MKRNVLLVGVFGVLLIVAYLVLQKPGELSTAGESTGRLFEIDSLAVDKMEIKTAALDILLEKKGVEWFIERPLADKADPAAVANAIHQARTLDVSGIVSSNPEKHPVFQVDSSGTAVTVYEKGSAKASFVAGKVSPGFTDTYVRDAGSKNVSSVTGTFGYVFTRALREWRSKAISTVPQESIKDVKFQFGDTTFTLVYKDTVWVIGKDVADMSVTQSLVGGLSNVTVDDFIDSTLSPLPKITAQIFYAGQQIRFAFSKTLSKYHVQTSASPRWYVMETWRVNLLLKRKNEFVKSAK
ncbi:MAG: hypothetical protein HW374_1025 [Bacteroidetes bacterium]|nr:hypothetical protein [Bacteroidota bacterium]